MRQENPLTQWVQDTEYDPHPLTRPACAFLEYQWINFLAEELVQNVTIYPQSVCICNTDIQATTIIPNKNNIKTKLVLDSEYSLFQGVVLNESNFPLRAIYQHARYDLGGKGAWQKTLQEVLYRLNLEPPNDQTNALKLLIILLEKHNLPVGSNFEKSIIDFSTWLEEVGVASSQDGW